MSHTPTRINKTRYAYYILGGAIGLLEEKDNGHYDSPTSTITEGMLVRHTVAPAVPPDENTAISFDSELCLALVDYVKARLFEDQGEYDKREFHMKEFEKRVLKFQKNRFGNVKIIMPIKGYSIT